MVVSGDCLARKVAGAHTHHVQAAPDNGRVRPRASAAFGAFAVVRGVGVISRCVNMKLLSACQLAK